MQRTHFSIVATMVLALTSIAFAQATQPAESAETKVRAAAQAFMTSLAKDDLNSAKTAFAGSAEDFKLVEAMHDMLLASNKLKKAAQQRWPEAFNGSEGNTTLDAEALNDKLDHETVTIEGNNAAFHGGVTLKNIDGTWKVVDLMGQPTGRPVMAKMLPLLAKAASETADEVNHNVYPTFAAAKVGMGQKIRKSMQDLSAAATKPAH